MLSSMCPTLVMKDGKPFLITGSPGGRSIINTVLQVVLNVCVFKMNVAEAVAAPRIHHQWLPNVTDLEKGTMSLDTRLKYEEFGHISQINKNMDTRAAHSILFDHEKDIYFGAADSRAADGVALGY